MSLTMGTIAGAVASTVVGTGVAVVTVVGLVNAQTEPSADESPADVTSPQVEYGTE